MSDDERPEDGEEPAAAPTQLSDWDTNNQTEAYAAGEAPNAPLSAFRSVELPAAEGDAGASGFEQTATNKTQQYGTPAPAAPQAVARQLRSTLTELDDVMPPGSSAWDLPANKTQQYGGPGPGEQSADVATGGAPVPAGGGWSGGSNRTQVYGAGAQRPVPDAAAPGEGPGPSAAVDGWGDAGNQTQRYSPTSAPAAPDGTSAPAPSGGGWDAETNRTQQYAAASPAPGRSLAPPKEESNDPWGSPDNNTAFYAHGITQPTYPPPPNAPGSLMATAGTEGTEPNPPAPRSGTEPYGQPISSASQELAEDSGPRPANLEEAARQATDEVMANRPSPRGDLPVFVEIGELDEEAETLDTEATPADGPMEQHFIPRGTVPTVGDAADSGSWEMSPPAGVNKADTSGPHIPKVKDPASFELEPPNTKPGE